MLFSKFSTVFLALALQSSVSAAPRKDDAAVNVPVESLDKRSSPASEAEFQELHRAAQLSSAAYVACQGSAFGMTITKQINDLVTSTQGYIGYDSQRKSIAVVMRGSTFFTDFFNDLDITMGTPKLSGVNFPDGCLVMNGIIRPWSAVHDEVMTEVKRLVAQFPTYSLESAGHSLGGALTYLSYIALSENFPDKKVTSNSLAAFPIGNSVFANFGQSQKGLLRRGTNNLDGVPNMYTFLNHYGTEFFGAGTAASTLKCDGQRDKTCSAGSFLVGVTPGHFSSFGVNLGLAGCR